jgi:divalent metal cation (Fe/Co/Zn/Cd) transporter
MITFRILVATAIAAAVGWLLWKGLDAVLGVSVAAQIISLGIALVAAALLYARIVLVMRIPEARQIEALITSRLRGRVAS